jgi:hypothetical protein
MPNSFRRTSSANRSISSGPGGAASLTNHRYSFLARNVAASGRWRVIRAMSDGSQRPTRTRNDLGPSSTCSGSRTTAGSEKRPRESYRTQPVNARAASRTSRSV